MVCPKVSYRPVLRTFFCPNITTRRASKVLSDQVQPPSNEHVKVQRWELTKWYSYLLVLSREWGNDPQ